MQNKRLGVNCQMDIPYFLPGFHAGDKRQQLGDFLLPRCRPCVPMPGEVGACEHARHVPVKTFGQQVVHELSRIILTRPRWSPDPGPIDAYSR